MYKCAVPPILTFQLDSHKASWSPDYMHLCAVECGEGRKENKGSFTLRKLYRKERET